MADKKKRTLRGHLIKLLMVPLFIILAFLGGYIYGRVTTFNQQDELHRTIMAGEAAMNVETLAMMREKEIDDAIEQLEERNDRIMITSTAGRDWEELPESIQRSMSLLKTYRENYEPKKPSKEFKQAMEDIPVVLTEAGECSPIVSKALGLK